MARRILLLITDLEIGGTPTIVRELAVRLNHPPDVVVEVACLSKRGPVADQIESHGIYVSALNAARASDLSTLVRLIRLIRRREYDTVFSFLMHANTAAAIAKLFCPRVRFLQSIQTTQPTPRWHWWLQRIVQHAAERVVVPSPSAAAGARDWADVSSEKIVVIPNALDPDDFDRSPIPMQNPRPYPIGFIGRLDPIKRVPDLLAAFRSARIDGMDAHLHIFGDGPDRAHIAARIEQLALQASVTLHGVVRRPQDALAQIGLLVLPSQAEGFGLVLIEAMAAGVPVVATDAPGIRDVVRHEQTALLVPVGNSPQLAAAIRRVVENPSLRERLIDAGLSQVRRQFSWPAILQHYRRVLRLEEP